MTAPARSGLPTGALHDVSACDEARLVLLEAEPDHPTTLDGGWWPRSTNLAIELPPLVAAFGCRGIRITRVSYHPQLWDPALRKIRADDRIIRLGWFRNVDAHLVSLTGRNGERVELLVVPPATDPATAARAMALAITRRNRSSPTVVLAIAAGSGGGNEAAARVPAPRGAAAPTAPPDEPARSDASDRTSQGGTSVR